MRKLQEKDSEKGLTLVELVISMGIFSLIMVAAFSLMVTASNMYSKSSNEVTVQNEVQTLTAHIQDIVISANTNVGYDSNRLFMIDEDSFNVLEYDSSKRYIYYYEMSQLGLSEDEETAYKNIEDRTEKLEKAIALVAAHPISDISDQLDSYLLAEYVSVFTITPHVDENYVAIRLKMEKDSVSYSASKNIYLRNKLYDTDETTTAEESTTAADSTTAAAE